MVNWSKNFAGELFFHFFTVGLEPTEFFTFLTFSMKGIVIGTGQKSGSKQYKVYRGASTYPLTHVSHHKSPKYPNDAPSFNHQSRDANFTLFVNDAQKTHLTHHVQPSRAELTHVPAGQ